MTVADGNIRTISTQLRSHGVIHVRLAHPGRSRTAPPNDTTPIRAPIGTTESSLTMSLAAPHSNGSCTLGSRQTEKSQGKHEKVADRERPKQSGPGYLSAPINAAISTSVQNRDGAREVAAASNPQPGQRRRADQVRSPDHRPGRHRPAVIARRSPFDDDQCMSLEK